MRRSIPKVTIVFLLALTAACASSSASTPRPEAFPRSRPVPNAPAEGEPAAVPAPEGVTAARVAIPPAPLVASSGSAASAAVLQTALGLLGTRYRFGGDLPETGFDCSGFVTYVLRQHGIDLPRTAAEQFEVGDRVPQDDVRPGDLVFFTTTGPGATHVGFVVSTGTRFEFVHAPADGASVRVERFDTGYWQQRWMGARRVF